LLALGVILSLQAQQGHRVSSWKINMPHTVQHFCPLSYLLLFLHDLALNLIQIPLHEFIFNLQLLILTLIFYVKSTALFCIFDFGI